MLEKPRGGSSLGSYGQVAMVVNTATLIIAAVGTNEVAKGRTSVTIRNIDPSAVVYIGNDANVTASNGMPLNPGEPITRYWQGPIYGFSTGTPKVAYIEDADL